MTTAHISRVDLANGSTHGWQVRVGPLRGYHSKLFSDGRHGGKDEALLAAKAYLREYLEAHPEESPNKGIRFQKPSKRNKSGVVGVHCTRGRDRTPQWEAMVTRGPYGQKSWGIRYRESKYGDQAKTLAIEFRRAWEEAVTTAGTYDHEHPIVAAFWKKYYHDFSGKG